MPRPGAGLWREIEFDGERVLQPGGVQLNLSAAAKGYAVDHVAALMDEAGVRSYLVEIGGELKGRGVKPDGLPWWVSVEQPPGLSFELKVALSGAAIATSGDYRRFFEHAGVRYAHTLDPTSGEPLRDPPASVSVIHRDCMAADAWSTALMVLGVRHGLELCGREGLAALFLYRENGAPRVAASERFKAMLD
jgi:thiamine biosynthesis lipoprotein